MPATVVATTLPVLPAVGTGSSVNTPPAIDANERKEFMGFIAEQCAAENRPLKRYATDAEWWNDLGPEFNEYFGRR